MTKAKMGDTKKKPAKKAAAEAAPKKTTAAKPAAKKAVKPAPKKATKSAAKKPVAKASEAKSTILEIADSAMLRQVSERLATSVKKSEHWHTALFAIVLVLAAYFSFQATNVKNPAPSVPTPVVQEPIEVADTTEEVVFNFPADYAWTTQVTGTDLSLTPGASGEFLMKVKNTGKATWYREDNTPFRLGTLQPTDELMPFAASSVISADGSVRQAIGRNRVEMMEEKVAPGETATFRLMVKATDWQGVNLKKGSYPITVGFLVEGKGSLSKNPLTWVMNVR